MNKVILIGNLTKDPELSTTTNDVKFCKFSIAVPRRFNRDETDFFNITVWRGQGENCSKYLSKGSKVAICGSLQTRSYDGNDGTKRYVTEIIADEVSFLSSRGTGAAVEEVEAKPQQQLSDIKPVDDGLPF